MRSENTGRDAFRVLTVDAIGDGTSTTSCPNRENRAEIFFVRASRSTWSSVSSIFRGVIATIERDANTMMSISPDDLQCDRGCARLCDERSARHATDQCHGTSESIAARAQKNVGITFKKVWKIGLHQSGDFVLCRSS